MLHLLSSKYIEQMVEIMIQNFYTELMALYYEKKSVLRPLEAKRTIISTFNTLLIGSIVLLGVFYLSFRIFPSSEIANSPVPSSVLAEISPTQENGAVLGTENTPISPAVNYIYITATPVPSPEPKKNSYSIAIIGDSMVDTMGEHLEYVEHSLKTLYPKTSFILYNYGRGGENVDQGLARLSEKFDYKDRHFEALSDVKPDILIIGSFGYNPFSPWDRDHHWISLAKMISASKTISPHVYILAEIAPLRKTFGKGPTGVNWDEKTSLEHSGHIINQLENAVGLSKSMNITLIDAFTPTLNTETHEGNPKYVSLGDGIHPSFEGHTFMADLIAKTIKLN